MLKNDWKGEAKRDVAFAEAGDGAGGLTWEMSPPPCKDT